jgi:hypothetical protein
MIESLRGVGYSVETAVADLVDNSIAAGARNVHVDFHFDGPDSWMTLTDDGRGMDAEALRVAMTVGGRSPLDVRSASDLGRFGMGLKTASFAQCRRLTVASRVAGSRTAIRRWDLDYIARPDVNEWRLLSGAAAGSEPRVEIPGTAPGTVVLWERMDRLTAGLSHDRRSEDAFWSMASRVEAHLAMVFHRYLENGRVRLQMGATRIRPWDPFLTSHPATDCTPVDNIATPTGPVSVQGFVLPHRDQLDEETWRRAAGPGGWTSQQGFYVYRNDRLLVSGGWLGLGEPRLWTREEPYKLARLWVSFTNAADADWGVDIRKSLARPPRQVRPRLTDLAETVRRDARRVFAHRGSYGRSAANPELTPAWTAGAASGPSYRINREHPAVGRIRDMLGPNSTSLEDLLRVLERTVPVQRIWLDAVEAGDVGSAGPEIPPEEEEEALKEMARALYRHMTETIRLVPEVARRRLLGTDPFQTCPAIVESAIADLVEKK